MLPVHGGSGMLGYPARAAVSLAHGPLFSVLVPVFNHERFIVEALESIRRQTFNDWEAIVVDDGSTDSTPSIVDSYVDRDSRFRVVHKSNGGVGSALNRGLREVTGDWICWLSSDDLFEPDKLDLHRKLIVSDPSCLFHITHFRDLDDATGVRVATPFGSRFPRKSVQVLSMLRSNFIHGNSVCVNRAAWLQTGGFDESLRLGQDHDMWLRLLARHPARFIRNRTCITRIHSSQLSLRSPRPMAYDVAQATVRFLAERTLDQMVPGLDREKPQSVRATLKYAFRVAADAGACIYGMGPHPLLLLRLLEWSHSAHGSPYRDFVDGQLQYWANMVQTLSPDSPLSLLWRSVAAAPETALERIVLEQASPWPLARQSLRWLQVSEPQEAELIAGYLASFGQDVSPDSTARIRLGFQCAALDPRFSGNDVSACRLQDAPDMVSVARSAHCAGGSIAVAKGAESLRWAEDTLSVSLPSEDRLVSFLKRLGGSAPMDKVPDSSTDPEAGGTLVRLPQPPVRRMVRVAGSYLIVSAAVTDAALSGTRRVRYFLGALGQTQIRDWPAKLKCIRAQYKRRHSSD